MRLREIKHCRLAMVGFFFMVLTNASWTAMLELMHHDVVDLIPMGFPAEPFHLSLGRVHQ